MGSIAAIRAEGKNREVHRGQAFALEIQSELFLLLGVLVWGDWESVFVQQPESFPIKAAMG